MFMADALWVVAMVHSMSRERKVNRMDDLISKLSEIRSKYNCFDEDEEPYYRALSKAIRILSSECEYWDDESNFCTLYRPSAERLGLWEDIEHAPNGLMYVTCSVCGKRQTVEFTSYCGNCGAKMERE